MASRTSGLWLIYAFGGGWGHLTRAAALARVARQPVRILTNSPYAREVRARLPEVELATVSAGLPAAEAREEVVRRVESCDAACLIVDTFPRGLGGELAALLPKSRAFRVLIHRDLNPDYVRAKDLDELVRAHYDLVIQPGPREAAPLAGLPHVRITAPWLIRSAQELPSRETARRLLGVDEGPCVLVNAAGNLDEQRWYGSVAHALTAGLPGVAVRSVAPACPPGCPRDAWVSYWPAMDLLPGVDVVVGGAGYNTVNECAACGIPLVARAWPRKYDRQAVRATGQAAAGQAEACPTSPAEVVDAVRRVMRGTECRREFPNGAVETVELLEEF